MTKLSGIAIIFLLVVISLPSFSILFYDIYKMHIRHSMKERLEKEMLVSILVDSKELHWVKKGKEIFVGGRMFDIKTIYFDGKAYKITGLFDDDETALDKKLENQQRKEDSQGKLIVDLMHLLQVIMYFNSLEENDITTQKENLFTNSNNKIYSFPFRSVPTPPPQFI